jgi:hypothetical protein
MFYTVGNVNTLQIMTRLKRIFTNSVYTIGNADALYISTK